MRAGVRSARPVPYSGLMTRGAPVLELRRSVATNLACAIEVSGWCRTHAADAAQVSRDTLFDVLGARVGVGLAILDRLSAAVSRPTWRLLVGESSVVAPPQAIEITAQFSCATAFASAIRGLLARRAWSVRTLSARGGPSVSHTYGILGGAEGASIDAVACCALAFEVEPWSLVVPSTSSRFE